MVDRNVQVFPSRSGQCTLKATGDIWNECYLFGNRFFKLYVLNQGNLFSCAIQEDLAFLLFQSIIVKLVLSSHYFCLYVLLVISYLYHSIIRVEQIDFSYSCHDVVHNESWMALPNLQSGIRFRMNWYRRTTSFIFLYFIQFSLFR